MKASLIALICSTALALPLAVQAAGGGAGGDTAPAVQNQDPDYLAGMDAVKRKDWQQVVVNMDAYIKRKPDDADAWTQLGHAHRLTGKMEPAFDAYDKALKINPKHRGAVEYLGEAYLQVNDLPRAEQQLKVLDKLCFFPCEEFKDLKAKISDFKKGKQASSGS